ncbi:transporter substrate-binding domain-containing protein [Bacillus sp. FJAT-49732]|uniref:Transporter substrate-binding domain-containing protein n=1 Tax=Lederbergia citrisecunda TaxID=2833583 RepID=A0A942THU9_9BACI|nr:transporter substrate-binding domain-containing protein [Lederbergia citrisecunda]MBS4198356.1 transporter substrate-binding domain-containing protein [Lederbergia citrisecunda]
MLKNKRFLFSLVVIIAIFFVSACGAGDKNSAVDKNSLEAIKERGKIIAGTSGTLYPTSYHEQGTDELTGYEVEILKELAKRLDVDIEFKEMGFDGLLTSLNSGVIDIAANDIEVTDERKKKVSFSDPYKFSYGTAIVRKDDLSGIKSLDDLKGKKSAGAATSIYMQIAREHGAEEVVYENATNEVYLRDVAVGRTDVILNDYYLQTLALAAFPELNITIHPDIKYHPNDQAIVVKKDNNDLLNKVNEVLKEMKEDGTITELSKKFFNEADVSVKQDFDFQ